MSTDDLPDEIVQPLLQLGSALHRHARAQRDHSLAEHEQGVLLRLATTGLEHTARPIAARCPRCQQRRGVQSRRTRHLQTRLGPIRMERWWHHCWACRRGWSPPDHHADSALAGSHTKNRESPVRRFGSVPLPWPAGRFCLPAQAPLSGADDHPASVHTPAELGSLDRHPWPAVLRGPGDWLPGPPHTAARLLRQLLERPPAQGGSTPPARCQRSKCGAARSTSLPSLALLLDVSAPAPVSRVPGPVSGACRAAANSP